MAKPPPLIVMGPLPATGPVLGLTDATEGHPSAPCRARDRFWSTGVPSPLAMSGPTTAGKLPPFVNVKSLFPLVMSVKFVLPSGRPAAQSAGPTRPDRLKQPWLVSAKSPAFVGAATLVPPKAFQTPWKTTTTPPAVGLPG